MSKIVKTFDGSKAYAKNCKKFNDGNFYEMNRQCFLMPDGRWYRINSGKICLDHETGKYVFANANLTRGVVKIEKGNLIFGYYTPNKGKNIEIVINGKIYKCISANILNNCGLRFVQDLFTGNYLNIESCNNDKASFKRAFLKKQRGHSYSVEPEYSVSSRLNEFQKYFDKNIPEEKVMPYWKHLPNFTYGIEYETYRGIIPENLCFATGLIYLKDGSLRYSDGIANEYASVVMDKKSVMKGIKAQTRVLNTYCDRSPNESLHLHIGGFPYGNRSKVENLFKVLKAVEDEVYSMFPRFVEHTSIYKNTGKDYCSKLPNLNNDNNNKPLFDKIILYLTNGTANPDTYKCGMKNPLDPNNKSKWNVNGRYHWVNFDSLLFKQGTVEFRIHTNTFNKDKIAAWIFITSAILDYAMNNDCPDHLTLEDVLVYSYGSKSPLLCTYLAHYVGYRKNLMNTYQNKYRDFIGVLDVKKDSIVYSKVKFRFV